MTWQKVEGRSIHRADTRVRILLFQGWGFYARVRNPPHP